MKMLSLPVERVNALASETGKKPELAIADLLSVLHARKMWAHCDEKRTTKTTAVFLYGSYVPTSKAMIGGAI